ncbi:MAG TPA: outer membrane protein assembly factor BamE [Acidiferrobacterales bacterium]|nr:outer membrane protein assembly factor BamE [Acidiferrobacterales bacterium]
MPKIKVSILVLTALLLSGCISIYKTDINQGNILTPQLVENLKLGMNKQQVRFLLGTPSIADPFHPERWDYIYSEQKGGSRRVQHKLKLIFKDDKLISLEQDPNPAPPRVGANDRVS